MKGGGEGEFLLPFVITSFAFVFFFVHPISLADRS